MLKCNGQVKQGKKTLFQTIAIGEERLNSAPQKQIAPGKPGQNQWKHAGGHRLGKCGQCA